MCFGFVFTQSFSIDGNDFCILVKNISRCKHCCKGIIVVMTNPIKIDGDENVVVYDSSFMPTCDFLFFKYSEHLLMTNIQPSCGGRIIYSHLYVRLNYRSRFIYNIYNNREKAGRIFIFQQFEEKNIKSVNGLNICGCLKFIARSRWRGDF